MSVLDEDKGQSRFFTDQAQDGADTQSNGPDRGDDHSSDGESDDDLSNKKCVTLRLCQRMCPCLGRKSLWDTSQNNIFKLNEVEETKYPLILTILEHPAFDIVFVVSAVLSLYLLFFSEGFLIEGDIVSGIIHFINSIYTFCVFGRWLEIFLKSKFAKSNQRYSIRDIVYSLLSVLPLDIFFALYYSIAADTKTGIRNADSLWLTPIRMLYLFRVRTVLQFFVKLEDQLGKGDMKMFIGRAVLYTVALVHFMACVWHRVHCEGIVGFIIQRHRDTGSDDIKRNYAECYDDGWIAGLNIPQDGPFQKESGWHNQYIQHYFVAIYWATLTCFRLGASSINTYLSSDWEISFSVLGQILSWLFVIIYVSGGLTSLLVEFDSERERYLSRRFAIEKYLDFADVPRRIRSEVNRFYDYMWSRSRGIHNWDMVKDLPLTMKSEIYYDINKFIMDQLPIMSKLSEGFLTSLSVRMKHSFYLKGEVLHRRGETGSTLFYIVTGYLEVMSSDGSFVVAEIRSGSAVGELNLLQSYPCVATVRCGTESDIMTLTKHDFKQVLESYPENHAVLLHRLETRLEQSGLLLALCEKHNEYPNAFKKLTDLSLSESRKSKLRYNQSFDTINNLLDTTDFDVTDNAWRNSSDLDDLNISQDTFKRIRKLATATGTPVEKSGRNTGKEMEAAACAALEADVHRAGALAKDLNIPRPPLLVTAPRHSGKSTITGSTVNPRFSFRDKVVPQITKHYEHRRWPFFLWKFLVTVSVILVFWYYTYQIAFATPSDYAITYSWHIFDVIFLVDFILDMFILSVHTPHGTLEHPREIAAHQVKTFQFWIRLITFIPFEYALGPIIGWSLHSSSPWRVRLYYILKLNRILEYRQGLDFFSFFEGHPRVSPIALSILRFILRLFYAIHVTAVIMEIIIKSSSSHLHEHDKENKKIAELINPKIRHYEFVFYWASQVVTGTGFGDIELQSSLEFAVSAIGLVVGTLTLIYINARVSCITVNVERRRVAFKQMYNSLLRFMQTRRFPKWLVYKVKNYYNVQWKAHEGTLIPQQEGALWDAPKTLSNNVCLAQAQKFVERIPLFKYCNEALVLEVCSALKQYFLPPNQVVFYPSDTARDLYIIVKGYCEVTYKGMSMGTLTEGRYIGLPGLVYGCNKPAKIATLTHAQLFCLHFDDFSRISKKYPKFFTDIRTLRGEVVRTEKPELEPEETEIPLPSVDDLGDLPLLFNATEVEDGDLDSLAEKVNMEAIRTKSNCSFVRIPYRDILSRFFVPVTVMPSGRFLKWWTVFRVLCALIVGNFVPIQVAFPVKPATAFTTIFLFDIVAWVDMLLCFHIGFYDRDNLLVTERKKTVVHYLAGPFLLDILGCFPIDHFAMMSNPEIIGFGNPNYFTNAARTVTLTRLNRMIQLYRIFVCGKLLSRSISRSLSFLTLLQVVPLMFLFLNVMSCIAFSLVCGPSGFNNGTLVHCYRKAWIMDGELYVNNYDAVMALTDTLLTYIISIYFVMESAFCVGFGDLNIVQSPVNRKIAIFLIISGAVVSGYLVSKLTACLVGEDSRRIEIRDRTKLLSRYLEQFKIPKDLRRRVMEACFADWDKTIEILPQDLFHALPPSLKCDCLKRLYETSLRQSPLFNELDKSGIRMLSSKLSEMSYPEGEFVFKYGDLSDDVLFIARGVIVTYTKTGDIIRYIGAGSLLGEISPLFDIQRMYTAVAGTDTAVYVISKDDFLDFLSLYPDMRNMLEKVCFAHYKEAIDATLLNSKEIRNTIIEQGIYTGEAESRNSEKLRKSGLVYVKPQEMASSKRSQILLEEAVLDPLRLPVFLEEGDNLRDSIGRRPSSMKQTPKVARSQKIKSWFFTAGRRPRDEMGFIHFVPDTSKLTWMTAVIHPSSPICNYISFYLLIASLSCGLTAYEIVFSTYNRDEATPLLVARVLMEIFFVIRILGNFRLAYFDENSQLVSSSFLIIKRYALDPAGLWVDLVSTFPFYFVSYFTSKKTYRQAAYVHILQFLRLILFWRYLRRKESDLRMNASRVKAIKISILLCFVFHFCACFWYLIACDGMCCSFGSWMQSILDTEHNRKKVENQHGSEDNLEDHVHPRESFPIRSRYLLSIYYVCSTITFTGLGDVEAKLGKELIFSVLMIFITVFVIGFLVGEMTQCLASQVSAKMHFRHRLQVMEHHYRTLGLSHTRIETVKRYFRLLWMRCNGIRFTELVIHLPYSLRADLTMAVYGPNIKYSRMYGKLDRTIIRQLSAEIRHEIYLPGTHIVHSGDICQAVYFVKKGEVVVLDESPGVELCVEILYENECFGEVKTILTGQPFRFSYVARLETEIGVLFQENLISVLKRHGKVYDDVLDAARGMKEKKVSIAREHEKTARLSRQTLRGQKTGRLSDASVAGHTSRNA